MLEFHTISKDAFAKLYCDYVCNYINGRKTTNPFENLILVRGNNVIDTNGNVIGKVVE